MEVLRIKGHEVEVDYPSELEPYMDRFDNMKIRGEKLQACSPFRTERHPSFAVNLDNGSWVDSGAEEESDRKGSFISLLAFFRGEDTGATADYLLEKYSHLLDDVETLKLKLDLKLKPEVTLLGQEKYADIIDKTSDYLLNRGICAETQIWFQTGISNKGDAITIPWHDRLGRIINIKYRSMKGKEFWFSSGGQPIKKHVYGLWAVIRTGAKEVVCVESEIDALYLWSMDIPAIAFGGASINEEQKRLILNAGIESLIIATDNDTVGQRFAKVLAEEFMGNVKCFKTMFPAGKKDVNDLNYGELHQVLSNKEEYWLFRI